MLFFFHALCASSMGTSKLRKGKGCFLINLGTRGAEFIWPVIYRVCLVGEKDEIYIETDKSKFPSDTSYVRLSLMFHQLGSWCNLIFFCVKKGFFPFLSFPEVGFLGAYPSKIGLLWQKQLFPCFLLARGQQGWEAPGLGRKTSVPQQSSRQERQPPRREGGVWKGDAQMASGTSWIQPKAAPRDRWAA